MLDIQNISKTFNPGTINEKKALPFEYPVNNISAEYYYDVVTPTDRFIDTDKDNVVTACICNTTGNGRMVCVSPPVIAENVWRAPATCFIRKYTVTAPGMIG